MVAADAVRTVAQAGRTGAAQRANGRRVGLQTRFHRTLLPTPLLPTFPRRLRSAKLPRTQGATVRRALSPWPPAARMALTI